MNPTVVINNVNDSETLKRDVAFLARMFKLHVEWRGTTEEYRRLTEISERHECFEDIYEPSTEKDSQ